MVASVVLAIFLVSWFANQLFLVGPVEQAIGQSLFNLAAHGLGLAVVLTLVAKRFIK